jgi:hypothetical protein
LKTIESTLLPRPGVHSIVFLPAKSSEKTCLRYLLRPTLV